MHRLTRVEAVRRSWTDRLFEAYRNGMSCLAVSQCCSGAMLSGILPKASSTIRKDFLDVEQAVSWCCVIPRWITASLMSAACPFSAAAHPVCGGGRLGVS